MLGDVDRVNGLSMEIAESVREKKEQKYKYSKEAMRDLTKSLEQIQGMYREAIQVLMTGSTENAKKVFPGGPVGSDSRAGIARAQRRKKKL